VLNQVTEFITVHQSTGVELADRIEWRLRKKILRIHSSASNRASDRELGIQSRTAEILSLFSRCWGKVKQSWKKESVRKCYKSENGKRKL